MKIITLQSFFALILVASFFFTGCSKKSATKYSNKNPQYAQLAKYTKIVKILDKDEVKAIVNITYLNGAQQKKWDDGYQYFIVGSYIADKSFSKLLINRIFEDKMLDIDGVEKLENKKELFNDIPLKNSWAEYQIIKFKDIKKAQNIVLKVALDEKHFQNITFDKEQSIVFDTVD